MRYLLLENFQTPKVLFISQHVLLDAGAKSFPRREVFFALGSTLATRYAHGGGGAS